MSYCTPQSVRAGDVVAIHLSATTPTVAVEVVRDGLEREVVWRAADVAASRRPAPGAAPEAGCGWPVAITVPVDRAWRSGVYLVRVAPAGETVAEPPTGF